METGEGYLVPDILREKNGEEKISSFVTKAFVGV